MVRFGSTANMHRATAFFLHGEVTRDCDDRLGRRAIKFAGFSAPCRGRRADKPYRREWRRVADSKLTPPPRSPACTLSTGQADGWNPASPGCGAKFLRKDQSGRRDAKGEGGPHRGRRVDGSADRKRDDLPRRRQRTRSGNCCNCRGSGDVCFKRQRRPKGRRIEFYGGGCGSRVPPL